MGSARRRLTPDSRAALDACGAAGRTLSDSLALAIADLGARLDAAWWHDIGAGAHSARALQARGLIREARPMECAPNCEGEHWGYCALSAEGRALLAAWEDNARKLARRVKAWNA